MHSPHSSLNEKELDLEEEHFHRVLTAFATFSTRFKQRTMARHYRDYESLPLEDKQLIPEYLPKLRAIESAAEANQFLFDAVVRCVDPEGPKHAPFLPTERDYENLRSTLRQLVRDWTEEGSTERSLCYGPIIAAIEETFPKDSARGRGRVLLPGAGLGRLAYELAQRGFSVQGNEFSLYMLLTSQLILNNTTRIGEFEIQPYAFPLSNHLSVENALRRLRVPDMVPDLASNIPADLSMVAGDFLEVYGGAEEADSWDCVVTCFFIDTAQNIAQYLRTIHRILRPGGVWINFGPLLYHFEGSSMQTSECSIELAWDEVVRVSERLGFRFQPEKERLVDMPYAQDAQSLNRTGYRAVFSTATKDSPRLLGNKKQ